jgi:hypothetical protein
MFYEPATVVKSWMDIDLYQIVLLVFVTIKTGGGLCFLYQNVLKSMPRIVNAVSIFSF